MSSLDITKNAALQTLNISRTGITSLKVAKGSNLAKAAAAEPAAYGSGTSLWKEKGMVGLSVSINFEGLRHFGETEGGLKTLLNAWKSGAAVTVTAYERDSSTSPYLSGSFVIASLEQTAPAQDDSTFSGTLENNGAVTITPSALTGETLT